MVEGTSPAPGKAEPNPLFIRHTTAIAGLYVALSELGEDSGLACVTWLRDEDAWEDWSPGIGRPSHLRPDAYVEIELHVDGRTAVAPAFVEIDFATMDQARLRAKVARTATTCVTALGVIVTPALRCCCCSRLPSNV